MIHGVARLQLATFPPMEDALPWKTRPFNTCHEQQSVFSPFLLIKPSSAHFHCTFCYYWCILRFDIGLDGLSVTSFSMAGYYNLEAEKDNKLYRENASNLDQQLIIIVITYLIYKQLVKCHPRVTTVAQINYEYETIMPSMRRRK